MAEPLVSVVVPAWNAERTLEESLRSIAAQSYRNLEILIVDDGSTDGTAKIAADFCAAEPRARLIVTENDGVAAARNRAIAEARGHWVAPIDADDLWHPTKIEKQIAAALTAPETPGFVYCWHRLIDSGGRITGSGPTWSLDGRAFNRLAYLNVVENGSALLLHRDAVLEVGGYDESLRARRAQGCEDVMIQLQIARLHPIAAVPEHLVGHRRHGENMSSDFDQIERSWRLVYQQLAREARPIPRRIIRWVDGKSAFDRAERSALAGHHLATFANLARALVRDPLRCGALLIYRIARSARRRMIRRPPGELPRFTDVDPGALLVSDPGELKGFRAWIDRLNAGRLKRLAAADRSYS